LIKSKIFSGHDCNFPFFRGCLSLCGQISSPTSYLDWATFGQSWSALSILRLASMRLGGSMPPNFGQFWTQLTVLDLRYRNQIAIIALFLLDQFVFIFSDRMAPFCLSRKILLFIWSQVHSSIRHVLCSTCYPESVAMPSPAIFRPLSARRGPRSSRSTLASTSSRARFPPRLAARGRNCGRCALAGRPSFKTMRSCLSVWLVGVGWGGGMAGPLAHVYLFIDAQRLSFKIEGHQKYS
jgi:hypothetical protein